MSDAKVRKAVVKTEDVNAALAEYRALFSEISGEDTPELELDRGGRGEKAFAVYVKGASTVVSTHDTKEDALSHYAGWVDVARQIMDALSKRGVTLPSKEQETPKATSRKTPAKAPESNAA